MAQAWEQSPEWIPALGHPHPSLVPPLRWPASSSLPGSDVQVYPTLLGKLAHSTLYHKPNHLEGCALQAGVKLLLQAQ